MSHYQVGIDIGSTTAKVVVYDGETVLYHSYQRHFSQVRSKALQMVEDIASLCEGHTLSVAVSGSAGMGMAEAAGLPFVQEVYATGKCVRTLCPDVSAVIELGGEDAKILFFDGGGIDERMNGTCAGGTGAFIDQMAILLSVTPDELDELSLQHHKIYPIASRCGVFAKTDIQPLLNQGADKADVAASIYQAVVNQTVAGLAQGRKIAGKVMFLGGPLHFCKGLGQRFTETLHLDSDHAVFPDYALYAVALGAAIYAGEQSAALSYGELVQALTRSAAAKQEISHMPPLFATEEEYKAFCERHGRATLPTMPLSAYSGKAYLGIDCGSTTTKLVLLSDRNDILWSYYGSNKGDPVDIVREQLTELRRLCGHRVDIAGSAVTGYGEELIAHAFGVDKGIVETVAHYTAAKYFDPAVTFILDIGGQDIKCFKVHNDSIDSIVLNEACSSGCGSFLETFAKSMGHEIADFSKKGLFADAPVNLGTRCTVFMNSSVKQAQKDGATVENISAGLSVSVVKNALYKVIRASSPKDLGDHVVVQGGTFLNDAVLRSFENELGRPVVRPTVAGLMGAIGAALYVKNLGLERSSLLTQETLETFTHTAKSATCHGCGNRCRLTVNTFSGGVKYVSGNQCDKGAGITRKDGERLPDLYEDKWELLAALPHNEGGKRGKIGLPLALGMYELLPLWNGIFTALDFETVVSGFSNRALYAKGQYSIPSDTACYPAKLMHGHIETLLEQGVTRIFYPCLSYNVDEGRTSNHYNCPVVAYYSELLTSNMEDLQKTDFLYPYLNINSKRELTKELYALLSPRTDGLTKRQVARAVDAGFATYGAYMKAVRKWGEEALQQAREQKKPLMILAGRPYHIDPEICHGINKLATSLGFAVVSEDSIAHLSEMPPVSVVNQWTYHARLYAAAKYAAEHDDTELVQLVSFGCGLDAITTDEVRELLEEAGKLYTQIKIDEITNLGAVKIRLRSLMGAMEERSNRQATTAPGESGKEPAHVGA